MTWKSDLSSPMESIELTEHKECCWRLGFAHFRGFVIAICFLLMAAALGVTYLKKTIHNELRGRIEVELNRRLAGSAFEAQIKDARWTEGKGLRLSGLQFIDTTSEQDVVFCQQVTVNSTFQLADILEGRPSVDSLIVDQAELNVSADSDGQLNVQQLLEALQDPEATPLEGPIKIRNSQVNFKSPAMGDRVVSIRDVNLDHNRSDDDGEIHMLNGFLTCDVSSRLDFRARIETANNRWTAQMSSKRIELNQRLRTLLQEIFGESSIIETLGGSLAINAGVAGRLHGGEPPIFEVIGRASDLQCLDPTLPHQIHEGSFEFQVDNKQDGIVKIQVKKGQFRMGYGSFNGELLVVDPLNERKWRMVGSVQDLQLTERMVPWFDQGTQKAWEHYQPAGIVDSTFDLQYDGAEFSRKIKTTIKNGSISWHRFPFRLSKCTGTIDLTGNSLAIDLSAVEAQQLVKINGQLNEPGPNWHGWLEGRCDGNIPINEKLLQAFDHLDPKLARSLRKFRATGHVNGWARMERVPGAENYRKQFDIKLQQATIRHESFDYPIYNVNGSIIVENDKSFFQSMHGQNNNGEIECNGSWSQSHGLQLRFLANNVLLNDELRAALPENLQHTWSGLRPTGIIDLIDLDLHTPPDVERPIVGVTVQQTHDREQPSSFMINPIWFPYEMRQVTGNFRFEKQRIEIRNFAALHGRTVMRANGRGTYDDSDWRIRFSEMFASNILLDESLRRALPVALSNSLDRMKFSGNLVMQGAIEFVGSFRNQSGNAQRRSGYVSTNEPTRPNANIGWDLEFGMAQANAIVGVPITNANGTFRWQGRYSGDNLDSRGTLNIDSMMYHNIQITSLVAPVSIDNNQVGIGSLASVNEQQQKQPSATARMFGGYVECDCQIQLDNENAYYLQAVLTDGKLNEVATDLTIQQHDFAGQAYAGIRLHGDASGSHTARGDGYVTLQNARIYEVPVMLALLNVLRIKEPDRTAFDQGQMEFTVNGENIDFQKIELNGDALSLIGQGTVNLDSEVDLDFYTTMGRNRWFIPVLTKLYHAGSKQVWWVEVDGTLGKPNTEHQVLPALTDPLKKLFPEFTTDQ